ncbi:MAG TPA: glycosyltransferase family 2 protein [Candidatus Binatia bacterium]|nr:glycosyltransferase family 2 protein [Candidatus Binatia bacterium]
MITLSSKAMDDGQIRSAPKPSVSAIVVCYNEEENIGRCLRSLQWCDEIVVVDSFSIDRTVEICRQFKNIIIHRKWAGYGDQKAFAHSQATKDWVLMIDSDEEVTPELQNEIREQLAVSGTLCSGFLVPRLVFYLDRWWRRGGWYPDYAIRLFRRDRARWAGTDPHDKIVVNGPVRRLRNPLHHFSYRDIDDHIQRINRYTSISSEELRKQGQPWRLSDALLRPAFRFFRCYFLKRGFMEGFPGFHVAVTAAMYVFLKYAKLWELELKEKKEVGRKRS